MLQIPRSFAELRKMGYWRITNLFFLLFFIGAWIFWLTRYGLAVGLVIGWLPAALFAAIMAPLWPISAIVILVWLLFL